MKIRFLQISILILLMGIYFLAFLSTFSKKGTFYMDEPAVVMSSLSKNRSIYSIFKDAAGIAQPPLEHLIREKIYQPIGDNLGLSKTYPEFFHRFLSLLWWLLPIGYFSINIKNFSNKKRFIVLLSFLLIISSEFFRSYLTEARHYSAIAASFATMIIVLLSDNVLIYKLRYHFLLLSLIPPLLHIISFPYYLILVFYFFYRFAVESYKKQKKYFFDMVTLFSLYIIFSIWMYLQITNLSSQWQQPSINNINLIYINSRLKWTLDWLFSGTIFYLLFKLIPNIIKSHLVQFFGIITLYYFVNIRQLFIIKKNIFEVSSTFLLITCCIWPLTIALVTYRSGMFSGERYSIAILVIIFFGLSTFIINVIYKINNLGAKQTSLIIIGLTTIFSILINILPIENFSLMSDENKFVRSDINIIINPDSYLISDNGSYSTSISLLSIINKVPFNTNYIMCRWGTFYSDDGKNNINDWLSNHSNNNIYLLTTGNALTDNNEIIWKSGNETLYLIKSINESDLCSKNDYLQVSKCYIRCTKGLEPSSDRRSILGVIPHLDIYRE